MQNLYSFNNNGKLRSGYINTVYTICLDRLIDEFEQELLRYCLSERISNWLV